MKKIGVVVASTAALLLATAPFAFADAQGAAEQHNDQHCGDDSDVSSFQDFVLFSFAQDRQNDSECSQDNGSDGDDHDSHRDNHRDKQHD